MTGHVGLYAQNCALAAKRIRWVLLDVWSPTALSLSLKGTNPYPKRQRFFFSSEIVGYNIQIVFRTNPYMVASCTTSHVLNGIHQIHAL